MSEMTMLRQRSQPDVRVHSFATMTAKHRDNAAAMGIRWRVPDEIVAEARFCTVRYVAWRRITTGKLCPLRSYRKAKIKDQQTRLMQMIGSSAVVK